MMPRWLRVIRGMIGTGLVFALGVGGATLAFGLIQLWRGKIAFDDLRFAGRMGVVAFLVGVGFSGVLAIAGRNRSFDRLSLPGVVGLGGSAGLLYWLVIGFANGFNAWTLPLALGNLALLTGIGSVAAGATLLLARRASRVLHAGDEPRRLGEG